MSVVTRVFVDPGLRVPRWLAVVPLAAAGLALGLNVAFADRLLPGVSVSGIPVGGLSLAAARATVAARAGTLAGERIVVRVGGREWSATNEELGITADVESAVAGAFAIGHEGSALGRLGAWADTIAGGVDVALPRRATDDRLGRFVRSIAAGVDREPVEGALAITAEGVRITEPLDGRRLPVEAVVAHILSNGPLAGREVEATLESVRPEIGAQAMRAARLAVLAAYARLDVVAGSETIAVEPARLAPLVRLEREGAQAEARLTASADAAAVQALVAELAQRIERPVREATFRFGAAGIEAVPGQDGVTLDREALARSIAGALFTPAEFVRMVNADVTVVAPKLTTAAARELAARMTLVSQYTTYYPVNADRAKNIRLGAARFDGLVLQPGETFSFWERIGEVSYGTGFVDSGAIIDGKSDKALAGGLCQVSTTLFGAVARAGFRVDERSGHSYYIERYELGLDAAVFQPSQDFRWTNDTGAPVILRTGATGTSVTFSLYTAPTGRSVSFSAPTQRNFTDPKPDQLADPAYPQGYVVRGRDVWVTRTVTENGSVVHRDTFYTHYAPVWGGPAATLTVR